MIMFFINVKKIQNDFDLIGVQILMRTFNFRDKSQTKVGGIPTETFIAQQPKAIES